MDISDNTVENRPADSAGEGGELKTERFTTCLTAYVANLDKRQRSTPFYAVHFETPPKDLGGGRTAIGMRFPVLLVTQYLEGQNDFAKKVARILEKHWDDEGAAQ